MLRELQVTPRDGEPRRRWFADKDFDLFVWVGEDSAIDTFQLCYVHFGSEFAFTWTRGNGYRHDLVDDGEAAPVRSRTPILVSCASVLGDHLLQRFLESSVDIDPDVRRVVEEQLRAAAGDSSRRVRQGLQATRGAGESLS